MRSLLKLEMIEKQATKVLRVYFPFSVCVLLSERALVAQNLEDACKLLEVGFEYVTEIDGARVFRKRK